MFGREFYGSEAYCTNEAIDSYRRAARHDPAPEVIRALLELLRNARRWDEALDIYRQLATKQPSSDDLRDFALLLMDFGNAE